MLSAAMAAAVMAATSVSEAGEVTKQERASVSRTMREESSENVSWLRFVGMAGSFLEA